MDYIASTANLRSFMYVILCNRDHSFVAIVATAVPIPEFKPMFGVRIVVTDADRLYRTQSELLLTEELRSI